MSQDQVPHHIPAPCIIDTGIVVNKEDIRRLLSHLGHVRYTHTLEGELQNEGEGRVLEVFSEPNQSTLIANHSLYINLWSFDYLQIQRSSTRQTYFDLVQENRQLRLTPLSNPLQTETNSKFDIAHLEAMVTQVLSAKWDVQLDDDCPF